VIKKGRIYLYIDYHDRHKAKLVNGYRWHNNIKMWSFPISSRQRLYTLFPDKKDEIEKEVKEYYKQWQILEQKRKEIIKNYDISKYIPLFKRKPYQHQIEIIKHCIIEKRFALLCEMGTGKTQAIINTFDILYREGIIKKCLIICPKTIMENWTEEIRINSDYSWIILDGKKKQRLKNLTLQKQFYILNYAGMLVLKDDVDWNMFNMVVLDESSKIKNHQAQRTKIILRAFKNVPYKYILSGTPITQNPLDIFTQFKFLDEDYLGFRSFYSFRNYYAVMGGYGGYEIVGYRHLSGLKRKIARHSIQLKKEDCKELPPKIYTKRIIEMSDELKKQYKEMENNLVLEINADEQLTANIILTKMLRLQQILSGVYLNNIKNNKKLLELLEIIDENLGNGNQIIIWCRFIETIKMIENAVKKIPYSIIYGAIEDRQEQINKFQEGKTKIFIGQIQTGGLGINLTKGNIVIYFENTFSLQDRLQSEARAHRIGQELKVTYVDLIYKNTIDEYILKAIKEKQDVATYLVKSFKKGDYKI